ncbi:MAG: hypothetical protein OXE87_00150 [Chloroflexi bacterium]|nr:hypothetical protein [Chloroflexota bacterium]
MKYHLDLFTPETWEAFTGVGATCTGFRVRHRRLAHERVKPGDLFLCYMTRLSRWCGVLQVESGPFEDDTPRFGTDDPFPIRFNVKPIVILDPESAVPIRQPQVWQALSITNQCEPGDARWTGFFRQSLNTLEDGAGQFLVELLKNEQSSPGTYPLTDQDRRRLNQRQRIRTLTGEVEVDIPEPGDDEFAPDEELTEPDQQRNLQESIQYQAKVAQVGIQMGFHVWVPRNDKASVLTLIPADDHKKILNVLPLNFDEVTLGTIENIDVLWLKGRSMARAFGIEHTTTVYSGLLRIADLLALQPNMNIRLHIVAPVRRREKVLREIKRPVFSLLERGPLYEQCSFLSYDSIDTLAEIPYLSHMSDSIVEEHEEFAEV